MEADLTAACDDPAAEDAVEEDEDNLNAIITAVGGVGINPDTEESDHPNNDFCFTEADFIETRTAMNDAMRHQGTHTTTWTAIKALKGEVVETRNAEYGNCSWTVIDECNEDIFEEVREKEELLYKKQNFYNIIDNDDAKDEDYSKLFWFLWPETVDNDLDKLNGIVDKNNIQRKEEYKRTIKKVSKHEYITFHALMIAASAFSGQGEKLWSEEKMGNNKKRKRMSCKVDFGEYMKRWRFRQIQNIIARVMECAEISEEDDWWKFKERVVSFNKKRLSHYYASHIGVFDESMSAFCPR